MGYLGKEPSDSFTDVFLIYLVFVGFFAIDRGILTSLVIEKGELRVFDGLLSRRRSIAIQNIISIERFRQFYGSFFKKEGSRIRIKYLDESSEEKTFHIREKQYSVKTIKRLLTKLKEIKPSLKLSQQYKDLLADKYEGKNFHKIPATRYGVKALDRQENED